jgi:hypothetical protein
MSCGVHSILLQRWIDGEMKARKTVETYDKKKKEQLREKERGIGAGR